MTKVFERKIQISDVVKWEVNPRYCRGAIEIDNSNGDTDITVNCGDCYASGSAITPADPGVKGVTTVTIEKEGASTADKTLIIGGVTFTAKASPSTSEGSTEYATDATAEEIAVIVAAKGLDGFDVAADGAAVVYTQSVAGTGTAPTVGAGNDTTITATATQTAEGKAATEGDEGDVDFIALENKTIWAGDKLTVLGLVRGPAMVDIGNVNAGDAAALETRLATLGILNITTSANTVYQET